MEDFFIGPGGSRNPYVIVAGEGYVGVVGAQRGGESTWSKIWNSALAMYIVSDLINVTLI